MLQDAASDLTPCFSQSQPLYLGLQTIRYIPFTSIYYTSFEYLKKKKKKKKFAPSLTNQISIQ
jgi:hypothetical protein